MKREASVDLERRAVAGDYACSLPDFRRAAVARMTERIKGETDDALGRCHASQAPRRFAAEPVCITAMGPLA